MSGSVDGCTSGCTSDLVFRNVDARVDDPVETWPTEAIETAMERGGLEEWRRIAVAVRREPWGSVAAAVESILTYARPYGVDLLMERVITAARGQSPGGQSASSAVVSRPARRPPRRGRPPGPARDGRDP